MPCIIEELSDIPDRIIRISAGGPLTAALTSGNDIYMWGRNISAAPLDSLSSATAHPLELNGYDFLDVAVGNHHVVVLTTEHRVFAIGANGSNQLGLPNTRDHTEWTEVPLNLPQGKRVIRVYAGYGNTLLLIDNLH